MHALEVYFSSREHQLGGHRTLNITARIQSDKTPAAAVKGYK